MTADRFKVVFSGKVAEGKSIEEVKENLARAFRMTREKVEGFFAGRPVLIKKDLGREDALKYQKAFEMAGALCEIVPMAKGPARPKEPPLREAVTCPECRFIQDRPGKCSRCGATIGEPAAEAAAPPHEPPVEDAPPKRPDPLKRAFGRTAEMEEASDRPPIGKIAALALVIIAAVFAYLWYAEARLQAKSFERALGRLGAAKFHIPDDEARVPEGEVPYRRGRVLVVMVEYKLMIRPDHQPVVPPEIHPVWYKLSRSIRASEPSEIDTLIRIKKRIRHARLYMKEGGTESKVVSRHIYEMKVFDMRGNSFIGGWTFDPGDFKGERMTREDLEAMEAATSDEMVLDFIESMPER